MLGFAGHAALIAILRRGNDSTSRDLKSGADGRIANCVGAGWVRSVFGALRSESICVEKSRGFVTFGVLGYL